MSESLNVSKYCATDCACNLRRDISKLEKICLFFHFHPFLNHYSYENHPISCQKSSMKAISSLYKVEKKNEFLKKKILPTTRKPRVRNVRVPYHNDFVAQDIIRIHPSNSLRAGLY